jgi:arsenite methyltransferase
MAFEALGSLLAGGTQGTSGQAHHQMLNRYKLFNWLFRTPLKGYMASQLAHPRGWVGRWTMQAMNKSNTAMSLWAVELLALQKADHVLALGFGGAPEMEALLAQAFRVEGLDRSRDVVTAGLARWKAQIDKGRLALGQGDLMDLPFAPDNFHAALSVNTVYFWPDPARGAAEFFRVLRPGGRLVLGLRPGWQTRQAGLLEHGFRAWEKDELVQLLQGAGFTGVRVDEKELKGAPHWAAVGLKP